MVERLRLNTVGATNNEKPAPAKKLASYSSDNIRIAGSNSAEEGLQDIQIAEDNKKTNKNKSTPQEPITEMPESIPEPPKVGVSKKNLDGAASYNKEMLEGSDKDLLREPMYRETIEYDDGTVITNIYEGDKLVKSIEDIYSGDPNDPKHGDTRDTIIYHYDENGNIVSVNKNLNDQNYIGEIGWADHLMPDIKILYDENGEEIKEKILDPDTGDYIDNPEYKRRNRELSMYFPHFSDVFDASGKYMGVVESLEDKLGKYKANRDPKYDKRPAN